MLNIFKSKKKRSSLARRMGLLLSLVGFLGIGYCCFNWSRAGWFESQGQITEGIVVKKYISKGWRTSFFLEVYYRNKDQEKKGITNQISQEDFQAVEVNSTIDIYYLPDGSQQVALKKWVDSPHPDYAPQLALFSIAFGGVLIFWGNQMFIELLKADIKSRKAELLDLTQIGGF